MLGIQFIQMNKIEAEKSFINIQVTVRLKNIEICLFKNTALFEKLDRSTFVDR